MHYGCEHCALFVQRDYLNQYDRNVGLFDETPALRSALKLD